MFFHRGLINFQLGAGGLRSGLDLFTEGPERGGCGRSDVVLFQLVSDERPRVPAKGQFEGGRESGGRSRVVNGELDVGDEVGPFLRLSAKRVDVMFHCFLYGADSPLGLTVGLLVTGDGGVMLDTQMGKHLLPEIRHEDGVSIGDDGVREAHTLVVPPSDKGFRELGGIPF